MAIQNKMLDLEEIPDYVNLMIYGKSGVGKTRFAGSDERVVFIAPEDDGTLSAKRAGSKAKQWPVKCWADLIEAKEYFEEQAQANGKINVNWIVIDSGTEMQQMAMRHILREQKELREYRDIDLPEIQDWQKWYNMFLRVVKEFNALPCNVLWTALVSSSTDEEGNQFLHPAIQGKGYEIAQSFASYMTSYGCMQVKVVPARDQEGNPIEKDGKPVKKEIRQITWKDTGIIQGKDRTGVLAPFTRDLTLKEVRELIQNGPNAVPTEIKESA